VKIKLLNHLQDFTFLSFVFIFTIYLLRNYLTGEFLNTGYPDWMVQAFRIKILETYGYVSWIHFWANGVNVWKSYQFIPHLLTIGLQLLLHISITRAMVLMTIVLLIFLETSVYVGLRLLSFTPITAFIAALLSMDIAQFWGGVADYSLSFGFAFFPLMLFLWIKFYSGKIQYLFPYLVGISFYMHPLLGVTTACLMVIGIIISTQRVLSLKTILQMGILLIASSQFWFPVVVKTSFAYSNPFFSDVFFLHQVIAGYHYFGFSLAILLCIPLALTGIFLQKNKELQWANVLLIFTAGFLILFFLGINFPLPKIISQTQFTRGATFIGVLIIYIAAVFFDTIYKSNIMLAKILLTLAIIPISFEVFISITQYAPSTTDHIADGTIAYTQQPLTDGKIWTSSIGTSSYFAPLTYQIPYSYMGQLDSNIISPRISQFMIYGKTSNPIPTANLLRMEDYFKISGVRYAIFDQGSLFTQTLMNPNTNTINMEDLGTVRSYESLYHIFKTPYTPIQAAVLKQNLVQHLFIFPKNPSIANLSDVVTLDDDVKNFSAIIYDKNNIPLSVTYPSQDKIVVSVPANRASNQIYLNESYDPQWQGTINNKPVLIQATGPNYMIITLPDTIHSGTLVLHHTYPPYVTIGTLLITIVGVEIVLNYFVNWSLLLALKNKKTFSVNHSVKIASTGSTKRGFTFYNSNR
jgi:hypothetical protein